MSTKPRVLWYSDSPTCPSGFGNVAKGILTNLTHVFEFTVWGINYNGFPHDFPMHIIPSNCRPHISNDPYGRAEFLAYLRETARSYDAVFMLQDSFIMSSPVGDGTFIEQVAGVCDTYGIALVTYFPIDAEPHREWILNQAHSDWPVTYTEWAAACCRAVTRRPGTDAVLDPEVVFHGVDTEVFYRMPEDHRRAIRKRVKAKSDFSFESDPFVLLYVGQNQRRKMLDWVAITYSMFQKRHPDSILLIHTHLKSPKHGWDMPRLMKAVGVDSKRVIYTSGGKTLDQYEMCEYYNAADCLILPSAEGWGMPVHEAMACGVPTVVGQHAALAEVGSYGGSWMIPCPDDPNFYRVLTQDHSVVRQIPDINAALRILEDLAEHRGKPYPERDRRVASGLLFAQHTAWPEIAHQWGSILSRAIAYKQGQHHEAQREGTRDLGALGA